MKVTSFYISKCHDCIFLKKDKCNIDETNNIDTAIVKNCNQYYAREAIKLTNG